MILLNSVDNLLEHIEDVQKDVISLSTQSLLQISSYIEKHNMEVDEDISTALQYQDIITQQLSATVEAILSMRSSIKRFSYAFENDESLAQESMKKLQDKLNATLAEAKDKKKRFSGQTSSNEVSDEIEFF
jgi:predicted RNA-binding protein with EMAP domain